MTPEEAVKMLLKEKGVTQAEFAHEIGTSQPVLSRTLKSPFINTQSHWPAILDALDLELVIQPRKRD